jgi:hypothetical protein
MMTLAPESVSRRCPDRRVVPDLGANGLPKEEFEMLQSTPRVGIMLVVAVVALGAGVFAAQTGVSDQTSPDRQLLAEVQALRAELREASRRSLGAQLVIARLQWHEQRLRFISTEAAEARRAVAVQRAARESIEVGLERTEKIQSPNPEQQQMVSSSIAAARSRLQVAREEERRLSAREEEITARMTSEERRWSELNARLEQMEAALSR